MQRSSGLTNSKGATAWILSLLVFLYLIYASGGSVLADVPSGAEPENDKWIASENQQIPGWEPPLDPEFDRLDNAPITFDLENGAVVLPRYPDCKTCPPDHTAFYKPEASQLLLEQNFADKWDILKSPPSFWPYTPSVKVITTWPSNHTTECSGILVEQDALLTAGHCIFTHVSELCAGKPSCWAQEVQIFLNYGSPEESSTSFVQILTWTAWTENRDFQYDLAGIKLAQLYERKIGWLAFGYNNDNLDQFFPAALFEHTSYPAEGDREDQLTLWTGYFDRVELHTFHTSGASLDGQAGACSHSNEDLHIVYSVLSHHREVDGQLRTVHTRITPDKFFALRDWINENIKAFNFIYHFPTFLE